MQQLFRAEFNSYQLFSFLSHLETKITETTNQAENLETEIVNAGEDIVNTEQELGTTIENVKPGVGVDSGWEIVNLDINNDGVVNEADIDA